MASESKELNLILEELEKRIAEYIGTRCAILCSSGRNAIRFSLLAFGIGHDDEVVIPDFACQILPITVFCTGARPRFCDVDREACALSPTCLPEVLGAHTRAIVFIHPFGLPVDPSAIIEITEKRRIVFVDDAAQALGASINGKRAGSFGDVGILSFGKFLPWYLHGGAVTTNDEKLAAKIKAIRAKCERRALFPSLGYRMIEICGLKSRKNVEMIFKGDNYLHRILNRTLAKKYFQSVDSWIKADQYVLKLWYSNALTSTIIDQLMTYGGTYWHRRRMEEMELLFLNSEFENIEKYLQGRRSIAKMYDKLLKKDGFDKISVSDNYEPSYLRYPVIFHDKKKLAKSIRALNDMGLTVDYRYKPLHMSPFFSSINRSANFKDSIYISEHILPLPIMFNMNPERVKRIASIVNAN